MKRRQETTALITIEDHLIIKSHILKTTAVPNNAELIAEDKENEIALYKTPDAYIILSKHRTLKITKKAPEYNLINLLLW